MDDNSYLTELESRSIYIIRESHHEYAASLAILWSMGKDSTVLVHLARKAFLGKIPVPVIHLDTGLKFKQIYEFRQKYSTEWGLKLIVVRNESALKENIRIKCATQESPARISQVIEVRDSADFELKNRRDCLEAADVAEVVISAERPLGLG